MARWTGTWLSGLAAAGVQTRSADDLPGVRLGLPASGSGAVAAFGARAGAFAIDAIASALVARLFFPVRDDPQLSDWLAPLAVLAVVYIVGLALTGQTLGMRLLRLRCRPLGGASAVTGRDGAAVPVPGLVAAALRTALLLLLVPALVTDRDGRGLHDRAARTVVVQG